MVIMVNNWTALHEARGLLLCGTERQTYLLKGIEGDAPVIRSPEEVGAYCVALALQLLHHR